MTAPQPASSHDTTHTADPFVELHARIAELEAATDSLADHVLELTAERDEARAEVERLKAQLDMPCGSCHPCTQWANQTWINAGERLPHVHEWQDMKGALERVRKLIDACIQLHEGLKPLPDDYRLAKKIRRALDGGESGAR